jgi:hypothetical protein
MGTRGGEYNWRQDWTYKPPTRPSAGGPSNAPRPTPTPSPSADRSAGTYGDVSQRDRILAQQQAQGQTTNPDGSSTATNPSAARGYEDPVGFLWFKPLRDVQVDTTSLQGVMNASDPLSITYNRIVSAGRDDPLYPTVTDQGYLDYEWLFGMAAKDYYHSSTAKKWFEEQFIPQAEAEFAKTGRYMSPVEVAFNYNIDKGLMTEEGLLTDKGQEAYNKWADTKSSSGSSGGGYRSYGGGGGGGGGGGATSGRVDLTSPTNSRGLLLQTMQQVLGRNPTENEYKEFLKSLNEWQTNNPTTVSVDGSTVTQSGGVDPNQIALDYAQGREDYNDRQAQGYYNVFMRALSSTDPGVGA